MTGLVVNTTKNLVFPDGIITGATQLLTVAPADAGAAIFSAQGRKNKKVIASIISGTVLLSATGSSTTLTVDQFTITGPGNGKLDHSGLATFRVGARATITPTTEDGDYIGTNTFRLVYN